MARARELRRNCKRSILQPRKIKKQRISIVQHGLHKSSANCSSSFLGQIWTNTSKISNMKEACLRNLSYVFMKGKMLVEHNTKIFHRRGRCYRDIRRYAEAHIIQLQKLLRCAE